MKTDQIMIISFGYHEMDLPPALGAEIAQEFWHPVKFQEGYMDLGEFYDGSRRQYDGNKLLKKVDAEYATDNVKSIALFNVDLFIPILTYIYGQAYLNGRAGIASLYRLANELYGLPKDENLFLSRAKKEIIHELGHMFGLIHCIDPNCVMRSSTYVEDIDQKSVHLCAHCREKLIYS